MFKIRNEKVPRTGQGFPRLLRMGMWQGRETCSYTATCECGEVVDYTDHIIRNVLLNWIYDSEIRKQVQSNLDYLDLLGLDEIVRIIEGPHNREYEY